MTLARRIGVLFAILAAILIADNILIYDFFVRTADYGQFMSLATRQSFLVERMDVLLAFRANGSSAFQQSLLHSVDAFDRSLDVLEQGGSVSSHTLPAAPRHAAEALDRSRKIWNELRPLLLSITEAVPGSRGGEASYRRAEALMPELLTATVEVADGLERWHDELRRSFLYLGVASTLVASLALVGGLVFAWKEFVTPVERLRTEALRVRKESLPVPAGDDLQAVSRLVSEMSTDVQRLRVEREEVEEELRQVEADYQAIFENAVAGICQFDLSGRLLLANPAMAELLGYKSPPELMRNVSDVHEDVFVDADHRKELKSAAEGSGRLDCETRLRRKDRSVIWVRESGRFQAEQEDGHFESIIIDVTRRKQAESSLRDLSHRLLRSQEEERRRIARELHDSTGQMLAALEINLDGLEHEKQLPTDTRKTLSACRQVVVDCSREVRSMSYLLHPPMLEELGLVFALREYAEGFSRRSGIEVGLHLPSDLPRVPQDIELALFRVAQEALTNIHRHAESPTAAISLAAQGGEIQLSVEDRGKGIPSELKRDGEDTAGHMGVGIRGMAERLRQLGGRLQVHSNSEGTTIEATLPLENVVTARS